MYIYPLSVATVRWKVGILNFMSRGIVYQLTGSLSLMLSNLTKCKVEFVTSKKCKKGLDSK